VQTTNVPQCRYVAGVRCLDLSRQARGPEVGGKGRLSDRGFKGSSFPFSLTSLSAFATIRGRAHATTLFALQCILTLHF
jgi:hypothetical protein